jgi:serine/threonine protein kinase/tetratricopeptide (TPR) repeat protein
MEDLTGKQLGPYQITAPRGEGGMAAVYKAYQPRMDRYVAMKILPRHFAADPEFVTRFSQEARVIANLQHPNILPVHDFGEADGYTYMVMRFIEGGTLSGWLTERHPISLDRAVGVVTQVGGALDYAHAQGVVHRDIKPGNILVDKWDNCLLTDFGLAKIVESTANLTQTGGILGTPAYMSPEQGLGRQIDNRSDIYSLGVVLYQMAVGHLPYQAETPMAVVIKHIHDPLPPPRQRSPEIPEAVERVILKSLAKRPEDRFATAGDMVTALLRAADVRPMRPSEPAPALDPGRLVEQATVVADEELPEDMTDDRESEAAFDSDLTAMLSDTPEPKAPVKRAHTPTPVESKTDDAPGPATKVAGDESPGEAPAERMSEAAFEGELTEMLSDAVEPLTPVAPSDAAPPLEQTELLSEEELVRGETDHRLEPPVPPPTRGGRTQPGRVPPLSHGSEAAKTPKSKLPWVLAAAGVAAVILVIAILSGLFSADEEEPELITEAEATASPLEAPQVDRPADEAVDEVEPVDAVAPEPDEQVPPPEVEPEISMDELRQEIEAAYGEGDMFGALVLLENAINLEPEFAELYCERAYAYGSMEEFGKAAADFESCLKLAEDQGSTELAREARGNVPLFLARMHIYEDEDYDLALAIMEEALMEPGAPGWLVCERAEIFLSLEDVDSAIGDFENCLTHDDIGEGWEIRAQVAVHQILGERAISDEDPLAALEQFSRWAELEPNEPWPHCYVGDILSWLEQADEALAAFERCATVGDDPDAEFWALTSSLELRAHLAKENESWDEALALYEARIALSPEDAWLYCERADLLLELDAREEALVDIEACMERSADDPGTLEWAEQLLQELESRSG